MRRREAARINAECPRGERSMSMAEQLGRCRSAAVVSELVVVCASLLLILAVGYFTVGWPVGLGPIFVGGLLGPM